MIPAGFDEMLHTPNRLRICVVLSEVERAEFGLIRDTIGVADSVLSKQLRVLVDAGYIELDKPTGKGRPPRTWVSLTRTGRRALEQHLAALQEMVAVSRAAAAKWATRQAPTNHRRSRRRTR